MKIYIVLPSLWFFDEIFGENSTKLNLPALRVRLDNHKSEIDAVELACLLVYSLFVEIMRTITDKRVVSKRLSREN